MRKTYPITTIDIVDFNIYKGLILFILFASFFVTFLIIVPIYLLKIVSADLIGNEGGLIWIIVVVPTSIIAFIRFKKRKK